MASVGNSSGDDLPSLIEIEKQAFVEKLVAHPAGFEVNSVPMSDTIICGLPRLSMSIVSSRVARLPDIEVSGIAVRHSRVTSSTMVRLRKRRPQAS